jgi:hypothetical protein
VLSYDGALWVPGPAGGGVADHGSLTALDLDHHVQYLLADGTRPLSGDLSAAGNRLTDLPPSAADGEPVVDGQGAGGDLTGQYPDPQLGAIQGTPVDAPAPAERDVLLLREGAWRPTRPLLLPLATIERRGERLTYLVWFHLDAPENRVEVEHLDEGNLLVERETEDDPFLEQVGPREVIRLARNLFQVHVEDESAPLRFTFLLERLPLTEGMTVREWAERLGIWFVGQSLELVEERGETVTAFHIGLPRLG